ncbi:MAG: IS21 family transposase [Deltaproteobacteria bacterium]|nr:IS21 family transposase [Deltaproteobacteria bacterium]
MSRLSKEEIMGLKALKKKNKGKLSNCEIARLFKVTEGTIRYHLRREKENAVDKRKDKPMKATSYAHIIDHWMKNGKNDLPPASIKELYEYLVEEYNYKGSYKSVLRFVRKQYPPPQIRPRRRVELPSGCAAQVDWVENVRVPIGKKECILNAFVMTLSFSRGTAVIWSYRKDESSWINCHNKSFSFLGGIPAVVRPDNTKTAVIKGQGPKGKLNEIYKQYARDLGFHINPARARCATDKGKVEAKVKLVKRKLLRKGVNIQSLEELQRASDEILTTEMMRLVCPATGKSVYESMIEERTSLRPCPSHFPEPFDVVVQRKVGIDCLVHFEGRSYSVPFQYVGDFVQVRGCVGEVQIYKNGKLIATHSRKTKKLLIIDQSHYEGKPTEKVTSPQMLGKVTKTLLGCFDVPVEKRAIRVYEKLCEVTK